jgi:hypothetical protein
VALHEYPDLHIGSPGCTKKLTGLSPTDPVPDAVSK